ncbi:MAG: hypothetical protein M1826_007382 [Phylliscum demangeonii]|nr:MAG: hypothetical protein M1826_007382 [Phylliscum demangeonii]
MAQKKWEISRPAPERESAVGQRPPAAAAPTAEEIVISSDEEQSVASYYSSGSITGRRAPEKLAQRTQPSARSGDDANVEPQQPVIESLSPAAVGEGDAPASPQKMNGQDPLQSQAFPLAVPNPTSTSSDRSSTRSPARYLSRTPSDSEPVGSPERPASPSSPSTSSTESEGSTSSDEDESDSDQPETDDAPKTSAAKDPEKIQTLSQEGGLARPSQEDNKRVVNDYDLQQHARQSVRLSSQHSAPANDRDRAEPDGKGPSPARLGGGMSVEHGPAEDGTPRKSHTKNGRAAPSATKTKLLSSQLSAQLEATVRERPGSQLKFPTMNPVRVEVSDDSDSDSDESSDDDDDDEEEEEEDESGGEQKTARPPSSVLRSTNATKNISALRSPRPPPATASPLPTSSSSKKRGGKGIVASRYAGLLSNLWPHKDSQG